MRKRTYTTSHGSEDTEIGFDFAYENRPSKSSLCGFKEAKCAFENGTEEVRRLLLHECNLIYECNICRNMFRNLVNFIGHKRIYCKNVTKIINGNDFTDAACEQAAVIVQKTEPKEYLEKKLKSSTANIENGRKDVKIIMEKLKAPQKIHKTDSAVLKLEKVPTSTKAMYQTLKRADQDSIKNEIKEVHDLLQNVNVVVGPDGKAVMNHHEVEMKENELKDQINNSSFVCDKCNIGFQTEKTLKLHMQKKHLPTTYVFQCPICTLTFLQPAAVIRHLGNEHKKSAQRIRMMRDNIIKKRIQIGKVKPRQENRELKGLKMDEVIKNEIKNDTPVKPISTCEFCGKSFERRAAYSSHMFHCRQKHGRKSNETKDNKETNVIETKETTHANTINESTMIDIKMEADSNDELQSSVDNENLANTTKTEQDIKKIFCRCKICNKPFNALSNVRRHISMFHYRSRKFGCTLCDYRAFRRYDIVNHLIFIHKMEYERETMSTQYVAVHEVKYTKEDMNADIVLEKNFEENSDVTLSESVLQIQKLPAENVKKNKRKKISPIINEISHSIIECKPTKLKIKRLNHLLPSGEKRPIRNRIKPLNNDFVYDDLAQKHQPQEQQQQQQRSIKRRNTIFNNATTTSKPATVRIIHFPPIIGPNIEHIRGSTRRISLKLVNQSLAATSTLPELPLERPKIRPRPTSQYPTPVIEANELEAARKSSTLLDEPFLNKINSRSSSDFKIKPCLATQHTTLDYLLQKVDLSFQRAGTVSPKDTNSITEEINDIDYDVASNDTPLTFPSDLLSYNGEQYMGSISTISKINTPPPTPHKQLNDCVDVVASRKYGSLLQTALEN